MFSITNVIIVTPRSLEMTSSTSHSWQVKKLEPGLRASARNPLFQIIPTHFEFLALWGLSLNELPSFPPENQQFFKCRRRWRLTMSFDVKTEEGGGVISLKVKIPLSLYISWCRALVKPGREGLSVVGIAEQGKGWGSRGGRGQGKGKNEVPGPGSKKWE